MSPAAPNAGPRKQRDRSVRVAVIEIGSRAIRLLVADIGERRGLETVFSRAQQTFLMQAVNADANAIRRKLDAIGELISGFRDKAIQLGVAPDKMAIIGTEAIRQIRAMPEFCDLPLLADITVLDARAEASCSLTSAVKGLPQTAPSKPETVLVIDQGGGSIELALGKIGGAIGPSIEMIDFVSVPLGQQRLVSLLERCDLDLEKFRAEIAPLVEGIELAAARIDRVIVQGSCATKFAWLGLRRDPQHAYEARRVHGRRLQLTDVAARLSHYATAPKSDWPELRAWAEPREPEAKEFDMVISGMVVLAALMQRFAMDEFTVGAHGTRQGMAWQLAHASLAQGAAVQA